MLEFLINLNETNSVPQMPPKLYQEIEGGKLSIKNTFLIYLSQMGKLTTMPAALICASISVHAAKEEESRKHLVKPEQVTCLQKFEFCITEI